jgi:hypothetical protein
VAGAVVVAVGDSHREPVESRDPVEAQHGQR